MTKSFYALITSAALVVAMPAMAQSPAFSVTGDVTTLGNPPFTLGYAFTLSDRFSLSGLGVFDNGGDGLLNSYDIGVWNAGGTLLASTTLGSGTAGTLNADFRYSSVAPLILDAGSYRVGALFNNDNGQDELYFAGSANTITPITNVTYDGSRFAFGGTLADPTLVAEDGGYFGPNLLLGGVPEPTSWALMIGGFGLVGGALRRRPRVAIRYA